jgi:hypothetical protein
LKAKRIPLGVNAAAGHDLFSETSFRLECLGRISEHKSVVVQELVGLDIGDPNFQSDATRNEKIKIQQ